MTQSPAQSPATLDPAALRQAAARRLAATSFIHFAVAIFNWFQIEEVHLLIAEKLDRIANGSSDRVIISISPRTGKSLLSSVLFPAYLIGRDPSGKLMSVSYSSDLVRGFGKQIRDIIMSPEYQAIFPHVNIDPSERAKDNFAILHDDPHAATAQTGEFRGLGVSSGIAGKGANMLITDDMVNEQSARSPLGMETLWNFFQMGLTTRLQPERNAILNVATRWHKQDVTGRLLDAAKEDGDHYEEIKIPAEIDQVTADTLNGYTERCTQLREMLGQDPPFTRPLHYEAGGSFSPRRWPLPTLLRAKNNMRPAHWAALYMQEPTGDTGSILLIDTWQEYPHKDEPPDCIMTIAAYDTAFSEEESADFSARTTWGVFANPARNGRYCLILLDRWKQRVSFTDLKQEVIEHYAFAKPDLILIEKRASGQSLLQELQRTELPVLAWLPPGELLRGARQKGKIPRAWAASVVFDEKLIYYMKRRWAEEVMNECADFPYGDHDDVADTVTMAVLWFRQKGYMSMMNDGVAEDYVDDTLDNPARQATTRRQARLNRNRQDRVVSLF